MKDCLALLVEEGGHFIVWQDLQMENTSFWIWACRVGTPLVLGKLLDAGCNVKQTDVRGRNGLYAHIFESPPESWTIETSHHFEVVKFLLERGVNPDEKDLSGCTVTDYLHSEKMNRWSGRYRRDLWDCALSRSGLEVHHKLPPGYRQWGLCYGPKHYRALLYLESWDTGNFELQLEQLEQDHPSSEEEIVAMQKWTYRVSRPTPMPSATTLTPTNILGKSRKRPRVGSRVSSRIASARLALPYK